MFSEEPRLCGHRDGHVNKSPEFSDCFWGKDEKEMDPIERIDTAPQQMKRDPHTWSKRSSVGVGGEVEGSDAEPWLLSREDLLVAGVQEVTMGKSVLLVASSSHSRGWGRD